MAPVGSGTRPAWAAAEVGAPGDAWVTGGAVPRAGVCGAVACSAGLQLWEPHGDEHAGLPAEEDWQAGAVGCVFAGAGKGAALDSELRLERLTGTRSSTCSMMGERRDELEPERLIGLPEVCCCCCGMLSC